MMNVEHPLGLKLERANAVGDRVFLEGNSAAALGAVYGGARCARGIRSRRRRLAEAFTRHCQRLRVDPQTKQNKFAIVQAEDELASIGMVIGAAWNGARAFTATSGPGISLMQEFLGLAYFAEIPAVIFDVQRAGPSTRIVDNNFDYNDVLNWEHGKHVTKFGFELLRYQQDYYSSSDTGGALGYFGYNGNDTANWSCVTICDEGYGFAEFVLDTSSKAQISGVHGPFGQRQWRDAIYAQDDWKILPNLTLNLGLRYSYEQPNYEVNNKMVNVNLAYAIGKPAGTPIDSMLEYAGQFNQTTGKANSRALINPYRLGFMPRFGFAYTAMPKLVVRGGYGSTDELESTGSSLRMTQNVQFQPAVTNNSTGPTGTTQGSVFSLASGLVGTAAAASGAGAQYYAWDPNMRPAVIQQFNLGLQYQIDGNTSVQAGYVGQTGQHLAVPLWVNQYTTDDTCAGLGSAAAIDSCYQTIEPYFALVGNPNSPDNPGSDVLKETVSRGISNYHSLQATLQHHQSKGLDVPGQLYFWKFPHQ